MTSPSQEEPKGICELCGEAMPEGEEVFRYHGYSGNCPKPPLKKCLVCDNKIPGDSEYNLCDKCLTDDLAPVPNEPSDSPKPISGTYDLPRPSTKVPEQFIDNLKTSGSTVSAIGDELTRLLAPLLEDGITAGQIRAVRSKVNSLIEQQTKLARKDELNKLVLRPEYPIIDEVDELSRYILRRTADLEAQERGKDAW